MEIRDPIHQFIFLSELEASLLDTAPLQRLRAIHQLSTSHLVYPGATHTRFEHALGTMELAGRAFDALVRNSPVDIQHEIGLNDAQAIERARTIVRLGGLLHDAGHTPFSHSAEELFPIVNGRRFEHELMTVKILAEEPGIRDLLGTDLREPVTAVAVGPKFAEIDNPQTAVLASLVTGVLGVDRMDYLLRDCLYTGVRYGAFDLDRIIATIKLQRDPAGGIALALREDGHHVAEQMLLSRWHMFHQVYLEGTRRIFDYHLTRYIRSWLKDHDYGDGLMPLDLGRYLQINDMSILSDCYLSDDPDARALTRREHLRPVWNFDEGDFRSEAEFEEFGQALREHHQQIVFDSVATSLTKPGDGEVWIDSPSGLRTLEEMSQIVRTLKSTRIRRAYCPAGQRAEIRATIQAEIDNRKRQWLDNVYTQ